MLYSKIHALVYRVLNKVRKTIKGRSWRGTPHASGTVYFADKTQLFEPHLLSPSTLIPDCCSAQTAAKVLEIYRKLAPEPYLDFVKNFYQEGLRSFGDSWAYSDINMVLYAICKNLQIRSYLEIGVRRGRSMAIVASQSPQCKILGFDLWVDNYCGVENPGKEFVRSELRKVGYLGHPEFVDGDSKKTVPDYFQKTPRAYFDLVTVDGDHSIGGAVIDLKNVFPRIKIGGILVFDDICSQEHPYLRKVWKRHVESSDRFSSYAFKEIGLGIGFAIRRY